MALPLSNTFESGQPTNTVITVANSAVGGDAFDLVNQTGTSTVKFDSTNPRGTLAYRLLTDGSGSNGFVQWKAAIGSPTEVWGRVYWRFPAVPSVAARNVGFYTSAGAYMDSIGLLNSGVVRVSDKAFGSTDTASALAVNTWYRVEFHLLCSATVGVIEANVYVGDSTSLFTSAARTNVDTGTGLGEIDFGVAGGGAPVSFTLDHDDINVNATGFPGPAGSGSVVDPDVSAFPKTILRPRVAA